MLYSMFNLDIVFYLRCWCLILGISVGFEMVLLGFLSRRKLMKIGGWG